MATRIAHLRSAERLLKIIPGLSPSNFAIGNIAPDSGIPDEKWEKFDPPGELLHFEYKNSLLWSAADLDFCRAHLQDATDNSDKEQFSFLLGYFFISLLMISRKIR